MKNMRQDKLFSHPDAQYLSIFFLQRYAVSAPHYNFSSIFFNLFMEKHNPYRIFLIIKYTLRRILLRFCIFFHAMKYCCCDR